MEIKVIRPGTLTTVQDLGRCGQRSAGLASGGAVDAFALRLANLLVGNAEDAAGLEMTMTGAELEFAQDTLVAVTGAEMGGLDAGRPQLVPAGTRIEFTVAKTGCRTYLAIAGGLLVPRVLGGCGTDLRAGLGGHDGRALKAGDVLQVNEVTREVLGCWHVDPHLLPACGPQATVRILPGAEMTEFEEDIATLEFKVSPRSDRMGVRLVGATLQRKVARDLISSAVTPGTVQVPPGGDPIVLLADAQTIGGYPRVAHVIGVDLPLMAQLPPGASVQFKKVTLTMAHRLYAEREKALGLLRQGLRTKFR